MPVVTLVMEWRENSLPWGLSCGGWESGMELPSPSSSTFPSQTNLPPKGEKPLTNMHGSSALSQGSWSVVEAMLRTVGEEDMHWLFSSTEKQYFSNCSEMQTRRGLLCNVSWLWGNLCYKSKLLLVDIFSFLINQTPGCLPLKQSYFVTLSLLEN